MAELIAMRETKALIGFMGYHAEKTYKQLCKPRTIKTECCMIITRMLAEEYRFFYKHRSLEVTREKAEPEYKQPTDEELDYSRADEIVASLNLTENMSLALDYRMSGLSYPEIAKLLSRAVSTVYEYFEKMRARYSEIYG